MSRNVVVTGGATGIGRAVAAAFAAAGDRVVILGRREHLLKQAAGELGVTAVQCDVTDPAALAAAVAQLPERVDVLVNNAGGNAGTAPAPADLAGLAAIWRANLEANVVSAALLTAALEERLAEGGAVVHIGSIAADKGAGSYGAAKAAVASWNVSLARKLGPRGITANVVSPGYVADTEFFGDSMTEARREALIGDTMVKQAGVPDDIAGTVVFLASPAARHLTAQVLNVNGGAWPTR